MKTVYSSEDISLVNILKHALEGQGIRCWVKNEYLSPCAGELPPIECWPQLCVEDDGYEEAKNIVEEALSKKEVFPWKCESCGERIEGQFAVCWKCGANAP